jgi:hypothetical protein
VEAREHAQDLHATETETFHSERDISSVGHPTRGRIDQDWKTIITDDRNISFFRRVTERGIQTRTTVVVFNLPEDLVQSGFIQHLNDLGFRGSYDFVYMPVSIHGPSNFGYALVNFRCPMTVVEFISKLHAQCDSQIWQTGWGTRQGLSANVQHFRNSPLMHKFAPVVGRPEIFDESGDMLEFPKPTKNILRAKAIRVAKTDCADADQHICDLENDAMVYISANQHPGRRNQHAIDSRQRLSKKTFQRKHSRATPSPTMQALALAQFQGCHVPAFNHGLGQVWVLQ